MGQEIERKYLIDKAKWINVVKPKGQIIRQGYISTNPKKIIRIRLVDKIAFLTIKGLSVGATRLEYEYEIPSEDAIELLDNFSETELSKVRYKLVYSGKTWEVDEFLGDNTGLLIAEIELTSEDELFEHPGWLLNEVTGDERYYNSNLANKPFKDWSL